MADEPETPALTAEEAAQADDALFLSMAASQVLAAEAEARLQDAERVVDRVPVPTPAPAPAAVTAKRRNQEMWAIAMVKEAADITASLPHLPPAERKAASFRAATLSGTANALLTGGDVEAPSLRAALPGTTVIREIGSSRSPGAATGGQDTPDHGKPGALPASLNP